MAYDTVQANGQTINVGNEGGVYENKLIDLTTGEDITIVATGHNPTIRNIGFKGRSSIGSFAISIGGGMSCTGTCTIKNIYLGDGTDKTGTSFVHGAGGIYYHNSASCSVEFTDVMVRGWTNNGFYLSNCDDVTWNNCYAVNCGVSHFRGKSGVMNGCVSYNTSSERYGTGNGGERFGRNVWSWPGPGMELYDCEIDEGPRSGSGIWCTANGNGSTVRYHSGNYSGTADTRDGGVYDEDSSVGNNPDLSAPSSVPLTPEAAANGESGGDAPDNPGEIEKEYSYYLPTPSEGHYDYFLEVTNDDELVPAEINDSAIVPEYQWTEGSFAAGRVFANGEAHSYEFDNLLADVTLVGENRETPVIRNGNDSDLTLYPRESATGNDWKRDMPWMADIDVAWNTVTTQAGSVVFVVSLTNNKDYEKEVDVTLTFDKESPWD